MIGYWVTSSLVLARHKRQEKEGRWCWVDETTHSSSHNRLAAVQDMKVRNYLRFIVFRFGTDWQTDWLTDWLTGWLAGWLSAALILALWHKELYWVTDWLIDILREMFLGLLRDGKADWREAFKSTKRKYVWWFSLKYCVFVCVYVCVSKHYEFLNLM